MGRVFDRFGEVQFHNEADVSQNFLVPLLSDFLGYAPHEILPERVIPAFHIPQNRLRSVSSSSLPATAKPDYLVAIDGQVKVLVCDSKGPEEDLDDHLDQLKAYCIALGLNLLLITNGTELHVYNANELVFTSASAEELDLKFPELHKLLDRSNAAQYTTTQRIQLIDLSRSLSAASDSHDAARRRQVALTLSDFGSYLESVDQCQLVSDLPPAIGWAFGHELRPFPAEELYALREQGSFGYRLGEADAISYQDVLAGAIAVPLLLVGESGIGKTSLLRRLAKDRARMCLDLESGSVPVLVRLGQYTQTSTLVQMIHEALVSGGAAISAEGLTALLRQGRFVILLDAFDEALDTVALGLEREIQALVEHYPTNRMLITTRHFRIPMVATARRYEVQPLSPERIQAFASAYLGARSRSFLEQVSRKGLMRTASNTLLLALMILLYERDGQIPTSRGRILQGIVDQVLEWNRQKQRRSFSSVSWEIQELVLGYLAFAALCNGESYALKRSLIASALDDLLRDLKSHHRLPGDISLDQVLDTLAATGFLHGSDDGVVFWHRAFMEYFAAPELARRCEDAPQLLVDWVGRPGWENALPLAALKAGDPQRFTARLLEHNVFAAGRALVECAVAEGDVYRSVIDALGNRCHSSNLPIRRWALGLLCQIPGDLADALLQTLLGDKYVDVQRTALVEVARRKMPGAREIVFSRMNWNVPPSRADFWEGPSGTAVIEALGELGDPEALLAIVSLWRARPDMFTDLSCQEALISAADRGVPAGVVADPLVDILLSDDDDSSRAMSVARVLSALRESSVASRLVLALREAKDGDKRIRDSSIAGVLASYDEDQVVSQLAECAGDGRLDTYARSLFAQALSRSRGRVPLAVFERLVQDDSAQVRGPAIPGLVRFPFREVSALLLRTLHLSRLDERGRPENAHALVQEATFRVLAHHRHLELLLEKEHRPEYFFLLSLDVLFEAIRKQHLQSMIPFVQSLAERVRDRDIVVKAAFVLADLGCVDQAEAVIARLGAKGLADDWVVDDVLEGIHRLSPAYALGIVDEIMQALRQREQATRRRSHAMEYIDALTRIATEEACERLASIVLEGIHDEEAFDAQLALRGIELLAPTGREGWVLRLIEEHPRMQHDVLRRAIETLGVIGGVNSLSLLSEHLQSQSEDIRTISFWAMHSIHKRAERLWYDGEEKAE